MQTYLARRKAGQEWCDTVKLFVTRWRNSLLVEIRSRLKFVTVDN